MNLEKHFNIVFDRLKEELPGAQLPWLNEQRENAMHYAMQHGWPTRRCEDWKYTSVDAITQKNFHLQSPTTVSDLPETTFSAVKSAARMVFIDGVLQPQLSHQTLLADENIILTDLATAIEQQPDLMAQYLQPHITHSFSALNRALMRSGYVLILPANCTITDPIHFIYYTTADHSAPHLCHLLVVGENSQVEVIEEFIGNENTYFNNTITHVSLAKQAQLNHYKIINEGEQALHIGDIQVTQQQASTGKFHAFACGGKLIRSDITSDLIAEQANCVLTGLYLAQGKQHIDCHTTVNHAVPNCQSDEYYKGILSDQGRAVFNGRVIVAKDAQHTQSSQQNKNLLLSKQAEIDTKPQLEIYADDVKCAHGATVGQLDQNALFYLRSRGIDEASARNLLVHAFAADLIEKVQQPQVQEALMQMLANKQ